MADGSQCNPAEQSVNGKALKDHTYIKKKRCNILTNVWCFETMKSHVSYNYVITGKIRELNDRTKEEKPDDFVQDGKRFYVRKWKNRGTHKSVLEPIQFTQLF